jgi:transposase-like protein
MIERTSLARAIERANGNRSIEEVVREVVARHRTLSEAAAELGVSVPTLRVWRSGLPEGPQVSA